MKTKVLLLMALIALIIYSCTTDREDEVQNPVSNKIDLEKLKTNNNGEASKVSDSIDLPDHVLSAPGTGFEPTDPNNPNDPNEPEIIPPGDIKPPKP